MVHQASKVPCFEARSLDVSVDGEPLLSGIDIKLETAGQLVLSGPSGSGKSSLLRVLCGLDAPASGSLWLKGQSPEDLGWPSYRRRVNLLFQRPLFFEMSVADNLKLSFNYASAEAAYSSVRAAELMDLLGLSSKKLDENPRKYSVGEQQRLCLLRSILTQPDLLLLDEPTSALDAESSRRVMDLIKHERQERGMAIVLAGHDFVADTDADRLDLAAYRVEPVS